MKIKNVTIYINSLISSPIVLVPIVQQWITDSEALNAQRRSAERKAKIQNFLKEDEK